MAAEQPTTANEYIHHHLTFLSNKEPMGIVDFSSIHLDSVFFSVVLAILFAGSFYLAARKATSGVPGKFQNFVELVVEFVDTQVKDSFHGTTKLHRAPGADHFLLGLPVQRHGRAAGRPAPGDRPGRRHRAPEGRAQHRCECHLRDVADGVRSHHLLQHQDERPRRLHRANSRCSHSAARTRS